MTEWREQKLSDFMDFNPYTPLSKGIIAKKVTMEKLIPFNRKIQGYEDAVFSGGTKFKNGDTLVARITPCLENGKTAYVDFLNDEEVAFGSTEFIVLRAKEGISDSRFIFYFAISDEFRDTAIQLMSGTSGRQRVDTEALKRKVFTLPPLPEQKAIAEVLSSLDDKIDLLTRQNKTLEDLAQAYFRKWFIEDASDEWEVGKAENYFEIGIGKTPPRKEEHWFSKNKDDVVWISISDMGKSGMFIGDSSEYLTEDAVRRFNIKRVPKGAIILSFKLTVGRVAIALREFTTNEAIAHFIYKNDYEREYLYFYLKTFDYYSLGSTSSIATAVNSKIIKDMPFIMPNIEALQKYHKIAAPIFSKIEYNTNQILTLQKLRDTLLPKLISGEIRVKM
jgi:type I restriction enzyme S subunit